MLLNLYGFVSVIMDHIIMKNYHNGHEFGFSFLDPAYFWIGGQTYMPEGIDDAGYNVHNSGGGS